MGIVFKDDGNLEFMFSFGQFVVVWNHIELAARDILSWLAGDNITAKILSIQTGNATLTDTVRLSSDWQPEAKTHLMHFAQMMDVIRAHRNYYVHSLLGVASESSSREPIGLVISLTARGKYELYEKALRVTELDAIAQHGDAAREFGLSILEILKLETIGERVDAFQKLAMPPMPPALIKKARPRSPV